ncbi:putative thioredoxin [Desarmillaria tabescens]|uniref:Thioredoxin n=1 Tax=Armillaria tabescens TaxID=1929756 RepID=A0AA39NE50_ARMTA|nr:putative thioredoxin [Desarmillaria tabescens]KAK0463944.1 putative thioredoxin [Desarmillaria tabescens]
MAPQAINSLQEFRKIIDGPKPAVIDFWATWCGPCKMIGPVFKKLSEKPEFASVDFYTVDGDEQPDIMDELQVSSMPTFIAFKDGNKIGTSLGAIPKNLLELIDKAVKAAAAGAATEDSAPAETNTEAPATVPATA